MNFKRFGIFIFVIAAFVIFYYLLQKPSITTDQSITPSPSPTPSTNNEWINYTFDEVGLSFYAPPELEISGESMDDGFILYVQKSTYPNPDYYQLYGNYNLTDTNNIDRGGLKTELDEGSIEETTVDGFYAIKGQYKGERNRFVTIIVTNKGILTLATSQPTEENRNLTDSILKTFDFK